MSNTKKINIKAIMALQRWRESLPKDKEGKTVYPKRKSQEESLAAKKMKLEKLMNEVNELKAEIEKAEAHVKARKIKELVGQFSYEELMEKLGK